MTKCLPLIDKENSGAGDWGEGVGHLADLGVVDESSEEQQEPCGEQFICLFAVVLPTTTDLALHGC